MKKLLFAISMFSLCLARPLSAEEIFFDNGLWVGLDAKASFISRQKEINFGFTFGNVPLKGTKVEDWAASPSVSVGYKFTPNDSISLRGNWAHYSLGRNLTLPDMRLVTVDGTSAIAFPGGTALGIDWKSDVAQGELEYQRLLLSGKLSSGEVGGILALLGFQYRYEGQRFGADSTTIAHPNDTVNEKLKEHLYGPYAGLKISFKPEADSNFNIHAKTHVGWLFKSADLRAREVLDPTGGFGGPFPFAANDSSSNGTVFTTAALDVIYSITKNWHVGVDYRFDYIAKAAHISNNKGFTGACPCAPTKITDSAVFNNRVGIDLIYKFNP